MNFFLKENPGFSMGVSVLSMVFFRFSWDILFTHAMCFPKNLPPKSPGVEAVLHGGLEPDENKATRDPWKPPERTIQNPIEIWR